MKSQTVKRKPPGTLGPKTRKGHFVILGAVCALVVGVYAWSAKSGWLELWGSNAQHTYYNLLVQGFHAGQLNLKRDVPPGLTQLANPYDPVANSPYVSEVSAPYPLLDLSYYKGKLHLYFGIAPALVLFWPYYALTNHYLLHKDAVVILCAAGFLASVCLLYGMWRRYFVELGVGVVVAGILALGLATCTLQLVARSDVHEVAISCGYALTMVTLALIWRTLHAVRGKVWWLAGSSLAYGLAVGARPSLLFGAIILLVPVFQITGWRVTGHSAVISRAFLPGAKRRASIATLLAATGPIGLIGSGLMLCNWLRFDNPFEFGWRYQLSWEPPNTGQGFNLRFLEYNFRVYFLEPAQWALGFPFVQDIRPPVLPAGHGRFEHPFGVLTNTPLAWLALVASLVWRGGVNGASSALRWFGVTLGLLFGISAVTLCLFVGATVRYEVEFLPALMLLAILGIFSLERALAGRHPWRLAIRWGWGLLLAFSVAFNLFAIFGRYIETHMLRQTFFVRRGQVAEAMVQCQKILEIQPTNWQAASGLGDALLQQGKVLEATGYLEQALRAMPENGTVHNKLGRALLRLDRMPAAIGHLEQAVRFLPGDAEAHNDLGVALSRRGQYAEAAGCFMRALQLKLDFVEAHNNLGVALSRQGKATEAIGHLEQALRLKPEYSDARNNLGMALSRRGDELAAQGKWDEAIRQYQRAVEMEMNKAQALENLGVALSRAGRNSDAVVQYREALRLNPQLASVLNHLALVLATETNTAIRNTEEAVQLAEQACALTTNSVAIYLDTLGVTYWEAGRFSKAVQASEQAAAQARAAGNNELAERIESRVNHYREGRPF